MLEWVKSKFKYELVWPVIFGAAFVNMGQTFTLAEIRSYTLPKVFSVFVFVFVVASWYYTDTRLIRNDSNN